MRTLLAVLVYAMLPLSSLDAQSLKLRDVQKYGWADEAGMSPSATAKDRNLGGGMLGAAHGAVETRDGSIAVLDGVTKKVVVFAPDGDFLRAFGGTGKGPGEFDRPSRIAVSDDDEIVILDRGASRLSRFTVQGDYVDATNIQREFLSFALSGDTAWFVQPAWEAGQYAVVGVLAKTGVPVDSFAPLSAQGSSISSYGYPGSITLGPRRELVYAGPVPSQVQRRYNGVVVPVGANRYPTARGGVERRGALDVRVSPIGMRGVAVLADGRIVLAYQGGEAPDGSGERKTWLELLSPTGRSLGRADLGDLSIRHVSATRNGDILLSVTDEIPQVWRVRLEL